jgi:predicted MFS family arabinose efflux permease
MKALFQVYLNSYRGLSQPVWMLALIILINRSGAMVIPFIGVYMTQSLNFSLKDTGAVLSCFGIGAAFGSQLGGWLTDKFGHFKVQLVCLFLSVPVFCVLPLLNSPLMLSAGVFVLSLISEAFRPANSVSISSYTDPGNVTKAFSLNRMAINLGFSIGPALGGFLAAYSYHLLFYGNAVSSAIAGLVFYFYFSRFKGSHLQESNRDEEVADQATLSPYRDKYFVAFSILCCLYGVCFFQILSTLPLFYRTVHHIDEWNIGLILGFSGLVVFALEMVLVHVAERKLGYSSAIIWGTLLCGISYILLLLPGKFAVLYFSIFILCISEIWALPFMATVALKRASTANQGAYMGMNGLAFSIAHIVSPYWGTRIAEFYGFDSLWIATAILCMATSIGFYFVMKKL